MTQDYSFQVDRLIETLRDIQAEIAYVGKELRLARESKETKQPSTETPNPAASGPAGKCGAGNHYFTLYNDRCDCGWVGTASRPTESHDDPGLLEAALASLDEWEQWEADIIMDSTCWGKDGMADAPRLTTALWDRVVGMQPRRFAVMNRLRELLSSHE